MAPAPDVERVLYYFPDRNSRAYADFDRNTWTARLGMAGEESADAVVGVRARHLPPTLSASITTEGIEDNGRDSLLCIQVDYEVDGACTRTVLFHQGVYHPGTSPMRWGANPTTGRLIPRRLSDATLDLARNAPNGWKGDALITFRMQNTGPNSRAKLALGSG